MLPCFSPPSHVPYSKQSRTNHFVSSSGTLNHYSGSCDPSSQSIRSPTKPYSCYVPSCKSSFWKSESRINHLTTHLRGVGRRRKASNSSRVQHTLPEVIQFIRERTQACQAQDERAEDVERRLTEWLEDNKWIVVEVEESCD